MESLETPGKIINLGKKLLLNLKGSDPDEITSWMINYIAELMIDAENGDDTKKINCFNAILKLWEYRSSFPDGARPLENLEPILQVLESLNPESNSPRHLATFYEYEYESENDALDKSMPLIELAKKTDLAARTLITFMLEQAVENATDKDTKEWIESTLNMIESNDINILFSTLFQHELDEKEERVNKLENRLQQLKSFQELCVSIEEKLEEELISLRK